MQLILFRFTCFNTLTCRFQVKHDMKSKHKAIKHNIIEGLFCVDSCRKSYNYGGNYIALHIDSSIIHVLRYCIIKSPGGTLCFCTE